MAWFLGFSFHNPFSVVAALVPPGHKMSRRSHPFADEASKFGGASAKSIPERKKTLRASATTEKLTSDLSNLMSTARRTQARHRATDGMSQVPPDIPKSQNQERWTGKSIIGCHRVNNRVPRFLQDATSLKITIRDQETDCSLHPQLGDEGGRTPQRTV